MGARHKRGWCDCCRRFSRGEKKTPNHMFHLFMMVITAGFWWLIWLYIATRSWYEPYTCPTCGYELMKKPPKKGTE